MKNSKSKRILVSWYCDPSYIPPFRLSENQVTTGPKTSGRAEVYDAFTPRGDTYDLFNTLRSQGIDTQFDAVVVFADSSLANLPANLRAFHCPTVLCVGDTHHLERPLQNMVGYSKMGDFDFVIANYNRQHIHWFKEAGVQNIAWLPGLIARHIPRPLQHRHKRVGFVGQTGKIHPRRAPLLNAMQAADIPLAAGTCSREEAADLYASSVLSFNSSLNGDLNLRTFEVMSAGGCLLADRLNPESGLPLLFEEGKEYIGYDSVEELLKKAEYYLRVPSEALRIAKAGHAAYTQRYLPEHQINQLLAWIFDGRLPDLSDMGWDYRPFIAAQNPLPLGLRMELYEHIQAVHLRLDQVRMLVMPEVPLSVVCDVLDLRRVRCHLIEPSKQTRSLLSKFGLTQRVSFISQEQAISDGNWHFIIAGSRSQAVQQIPHYKLVVLPVSKEQSSAA